MASVRSMGAPSGHDMQLQLLSQQLEPCYVAGKFPEGVVSVLGSGLQVRLKWIGSSGERAKAVCTCLAEKDIRNAAYQMMLISVLVELRRWGDLSSLASNWTELLLGSELHAVKRLLRCAG